MKNIGQPHLFEPPPSAHLTLADRFLVPPFSVLEARAGYWQKRKQEWINLGIRGELGRAEALALGAVGDPNALRQAGRDAPTAEALAAAGSDLRPERLPSSRSFNSREAALLAASEPEPEAVADEQAQAAEVAELLGITVDAALAGARRSSSPGQGEAPAGRAAGLAYGQGMDEDTYYRAERERGIALLMQMHECSEAEAEARWAKQEAGRKDRKGGKLDSGQGRPEGLLGGLPGAGNSKGMGASLLKSGEGRGDNLISKAAVREGYGGDYDLGKGENAWGGSGTSIFDPVLCEVAYRWYCPAGGKVLDPFAGGSVRGVVAAHLGLAYTGVDLSPQQVAANEAQRDGIGAQFAWPHQPQWHVGDAVHIDAVLGGAKPTYDFLFTCPPYYDLEVYSANPADLSAAPSYEDFREGYEVALAQAAAYLKPDRFAILVVGEVRNKRGAYVGLVPDTIRAMEAAGLSYYNEGILVTSVGSLPIRTSALFGPGRKLGKSHQNVLGFVKGDWRKAAAACPMPAEIAVEYGGATWHTDGTVEVEA